LFVIKFDYKLMRCEIRQPAGFDKININTMVKEFKKWNELKVAYPIDIEGMRIKLIKT
jgi:hypothetical protein